MQRKLTMGVLLLAAVLSGCKGWLGNGSPLFDPDDEDPDVELQTAEGLWSGSQLVAGASSRTDARMLVLPGRFAWLLLPDADGREARVVGADLQVDGQQLEADAACYVARGRGLFERAGEVSVEGDVRQQESLDLQLQSECDTLRDSASVNLQYVDRYIRTSATDDLQGSYSRSLEDSGEMQLDIDSSGELEGSIASGCRFTGRGSSAHPDKNLFSFTVELEEGCDYSGVMTGWGWLKLDSSGSRTGLTAVLRPEAGEPLLLLDVERD